MKKIIALLVMLFSLSAFADQVEVKGIGTIPYDGAVFSKDPSSDDKKKVIDAAKMSAWKNYLASLNDSKQKMLLIHEKEVSANFDKFITQFVIVDQKVDKELKSFEAPTNPDWVNNYHKTGELPKYKYDGTIRSSSVDKGKSITIRTPEQAYILGSKEDIEGFTRFVNK